MAQHDYNIANQSGADFRADLNNALLAIATVNSGSTEPSTTFAHQLWVDTSSSVLKIRNAADNAWVTTGISITASNTFTGNLTGDVTGNLTGNVTGNVIGDLTGNADSADTLSTARTISLSGDVVGSVSFDGSANVDIDTVVQINSITLGTDTTGDYVESMSGGTGVTVTGGTGEGSTPSVAIGQAVATSDNVTFNIITATEEFIGDIDGAVRFTAKTDEALSKGDVVYVSGVSGNTTTVGKAKADDASKMPAFGMAIEDANANNNLQIVTFGNLTSIDTSNESVGEILYVSTTAGEYTTTAPSGESSQIQNIGKVLRSHAVNGSIKVGGAGRSNATPNLDNGKIFIGNGSNQAVTSTLDTSIVVENTNLYYTTARANTDFDSRLATKDTGDLTEGSNLYYTTARVNSDFDTRLATKDTGDLAEGSNLYYTTARANSAFDTRLATKDTDDVSEGTTNLYYTSSRANTDFDTRLATKSTTNLAEGTNLYYTTARFDSAFTSKDTDDLSEGTTNLYYTQSRFDSAFGNKTTADLTENTNLYYTDTRANSAIDARVTKAFVDALNIQAASVDANSVTLGTDTVGNYIQTVTGTANKITVSGSGSESADITLSLPDDVQIASDLTVAGNLTVNGTLTSLDTTNLDIEDNLFQLNAGLTGSPVNDSGMLINRGTADNGIFMWDESVDKFTLGLTTADGSATGNITLSSLGTLVANLEGSVTGNITGQVSDISNFTTANLTENTNLYYTQARFDSALAAKSTTNLSEGSNLYYTDARFDTRLASKDTDDVSEGTSNLYYTSTRFNSAFSGKSTSDLSEGSNLYYTDARVEAVSINNVVEDTTPQLGGNLDLNSSDITGTGDINITGTVTADGLTLGSNEYIQMGGAGELQIFNDGSNTVLRSSDNFLIQRDTSPRTSIKVTDSSGEVQLSYAGSPKLATTSTGIDVTGTATMDGLTVENTSGATLDINTNLVGADSKILLHEGSTASPANGASIRYDGANNLFKIGVGSSVDTTRLTIARDTGNVGIGTSVTNSGRPLHLHVASSGSAFQQFTNTTTGTAGGDGFLVGVSSTEQAYLYNQENTDMVFATNDTERMRINASGSVTINSSGTIPTGVLLGKQLVVGSSTGSEIIAFREDTSVAVGDKVGAFLIGNSDTDGAEDHLVGMWGKVSSTNGSQDLHFAAGRSGYEGDSPQMTLDSSGNCGIGTSSPTEKLTVNGAILASGALQDDRTSTAAIDFTSNVTRFISYGASGVGGQFAFRTAGGGASSVERVRINYDGKVGIGTASPSQQLTVYNSTAPKISLDYAGGSNNGGSIDFNLINAGVPAPLTTQIKVIDDGAYRQHLTFLTKTSGTDSSGMSERMRINAIGNLIIGTTNSNPVNIGDHRLVVELNSSTAGIAVGADGLVDSRQVMTFYNDNGTAGTIVTSGSSTSYNTSSDYRLKENVDYDFTALDRVAQLKPARFNFIADANKTVDGFLAHEVQDIVPEAIQGEKDAVREEEYEVTPAVLDDDGNVVTEAEMGTREVPEYQGIDQSKLVPLLTKAIQEQQELINNLTSRIEQLEN